MGILVNNVGVAYDYPKYYHEVNEQMCDRLLNINITSVLEMTRIVLPKMMKNNRGAIVNVASISAVVPVALLSVYSASKAFIDFFSRNLSVECNNNSIIVQSLTPVLVLSNMIRINKPTLFIPSPTKFAKQAVNTIGLSDRTTGYWPHELQLIYIDLMPSFWTQAEMFNTCKRLRASAIKAGQKKDN